MRTPLRHRLRWLRVGSPTVLVTVGVVVLIVIAVVLLPGRLGRDQQPTSGPVDGWPTSPPGDPRPDSAGEQEGADPEPALEPGEAAAPTPSRDWQADSGPAAAQPIGGVTPGPSTGPRSRPEPASAGPALLRIPSLRLDAPLQTAEIHDRVFAVPKDPAVVGAFHAGVRGGLPERLGAPSGTTLVSGHVTVGSQHGALWSLHGLQPGAELVTTDGAQKSQRWRAVKLTTVRADQLPADLTDSSGARRLVLVTCAGPVETHQGVRRFRDNLVVEAVPV